jgi:subtilisin family serine protease
MWRSAERDTGRWGGLGRPTPRCRLSLILVALLAVGATSASASGLHENRPPLCGIATPVDELLDCELSQPPSPSSGAGNPATGGTQQQSVASLPEQQPHSIPAAARFVPDILLVKFRRGTSLRQQSEVLARAGVTAAARIPALRVVVVRMAARERDAALTRLRASDFVAGAEKDAVLQGLDVTPNDGYWSAQWGLRRVGLPSAWDHTHGSSATVVAVLDTGVVAGRQDLAGAILPGYNLLDPGVAPTDDNGHGTAVAGIIAARTNNHEGIAGVCWTCSILPIKVLAADGSGDTALVAAGIVRAADAGARVISMSLGGPADDQTLDEAVAYALRKGAILVAAAGNNGSSAPFYPADVPGVVSVAASDESDRLYPWSNFGSWVQIAAPGCNVAPARASGYELFCGTSSATPLIAGLIALELSEQPTATRDAVVNAIDSTAMPMGDGVSRGRVDAAATLAALVPPLVTPPLVAPNPTFKVKGSLSRRASRRLYRRVLGAGLLTATLSFTGAKTLTLSIRDQANTLLAQTSGRSPLRLLQRVPGGRFSIAVAGGGTTSTFQLVLTNHSDN